MIRTHRKAKKSSLRYEVYKAFRKWPDGRLEASNSRAGHQWYREQVVAMAERQAWKCGLIEHGECREPDRLMDDPMTAPQSVHVATFEHADKRGMGGARRNDDINALGNCAAHWICNAQLGSRRVK